MYLFSDTGAATVDQSVFIFSNWADNTDRVAYLHGSVLPCGSSQIEFQAANIDGSVTPENLDMWRDRKERGSTEPQLAKAKNMLTEPLSRGTETTLACAKRKLFVKEAAKTTSNCISGHYVDTTQEWEKAIYLTH